MRPAIAGNRRRSGPRTKRLGPAPAAIDFQDRQTPGKNAGKMKEDRGLSPHTQAVAYIFASSDRIHASTASIDTPLQCSRRDLSNKV